MKHREFMEKLLWTVAIIALAAFVSAIGVMTIVIKVCPELPMNKVWAYGITAGFVAMFTIISKSLPHESRSRRDEMVVAWKVPTIQEIIARRQRQKAVNERIDRYFYLRKKRNKIPARYFDIPLESEK